MKLFFDIQRFSDINNSKSWYKVAGTDSADMITNTGSYVTISGNGGDDLITNDYGSYGAYNNKIFGDDGNDTIYAHGNNYITIDGGNGNDFINASGTAISINGGDGDDTINSYASDEESIVEAGEGNNYIDSNAPGVYSGGGDDTIYYSGSGDVEAGNGNNKIYNNGAYRIVTGSGNDYISNNLRGTYVMTGGGNDTIYNSSTTPGGYVDIEGNFNYYVGGNRYFYSSGNDVMYLVAGDTILGTATSSLLSGEDLIINTSNGSITVKDGRSRFVNVGATTYIGGNLGAAPAQLTNTKSDVRISGGGRDSTITSSGSNVTIVGGTGNDLINNSGSKATYVYAVGAGNDTINGANGGDTVYVNGYGCSTEKSGNDLLVNVLGSGTMTFKDSANKSLNVALTGNYNENTLTKINTNTITGTAADDTVKNWGKSVTIESGAGNDSISNWGESVNINSGAGDDYIYNAIDHAVVYGWYDTDNKIGPYGTGWIEYGTTKTSSLKVTYDQIDVAGKAGKLIPTDSMTYSHFNMINVSGGNNFSINGGDGNDTLYNNYGDGVIAGGGGNDVISLSSAFVTSINNTVIGGIGNNNTINGGTGNDTIYANTSYNDTIYTSSAVSGVNRIYQYANDDGNDVIFGFRPSDTIQITSGTYSTQKSGNDMLVRVGSGSITLKNAANKTLHITGTQGNNPVTTPPDTTPADTTPADTTPADTTSGGTNSVTINDSSSSPFTATDNVKYIRANDRTKPVMIVGNALANDIYCGSGGASVLGNGGNDYICGGDGKDSLLGGAGNDQIYGFDGNDTLFGGTDNDLIDGGEDNDLIYGDVGNDTLEGSSGNDTLSGGDGDDSLLGDSDNDSLSGGAGADTLNGGKGNDTLTGGTGADVFVSNTSGGNDVITDYAAEDRIKLIGVSNSNLKINGNDAIFEFGNGNSFTVKDSKFKVVTIEHSEGSTFSIIPNMVASITDTTSGGNSSDTTSGGSSSSSNTTSGGSSTDTTSGGDTDTNSGEIDDDFVKLTLTDDDGQERYIYYEDIYIVDASARSVDITIGGNYLPNSIYGGSGDDSICGETGNDFINGYAGNDTIRGGSGNDKIFGDYGNDKLYGDAGKDSLEGGNGKDFLSGGVGVDTLNGGKGNDTLTGGAGKDVFVYASGDGNDIITDYAVGDKIKITGAKISKASTSGTNVILTVGKGKITLKNAAGKKLSIYNNATALINTIVGASASNASNVTVDNSSSSTVTVGAAVKCIDASKRTKAVALIGNALANTIKGGSAVDTIYGGAGNDSILGNAGNDKLFGDAGNDTLTGGKGNDTLRGGSGADMFFYTAGDGNDVITDYTAQDKISVTGGTYTKSTVGNDVKIKVGSGSILLKNAKNKTVNINTSTKTSTTTSKSNSAFLIPNSSLTERWFTENDDNYSAVFTSDISSILKENSDVANLNYSYDVRSWPSTQINDILTSSIGFTNRIDIKK